MTVKSIMITLPNEDYYTAIGRLTGNWAALETLICSAIWQIGEIPDAIGASITSQIYTLDGKQKALQAILRLRGFEAIAKELNVFWDKKLRALLEFRNRHIHDPILFTETGVKRLQITANKALTMGYQDEDLDEIEAKEKAIAHAMDEFGRIIQPALDACPTLPTTSPERRAKASPPP